MKKLKFIKKGLKTEQIFQEKTDKNWIEDKMIRLEKENARLNKSLQKTQLNAFDICNSKIRNENKVTNHSKNENSEYSTLDEKIDNDDRGGYQPPSFD